MPSTLPGQRSFEQQIVEEINLADREVIGGAPVGVDPVKQFSREGICFPSLNAIRWIRHFSFSIRALIATTTVLAAISTAPTAGLSSTPHA